MHRLHCPVATSDGRVIETGVGVGNDLIDMSRTNGSIVINIEYYKDVDSVRNELKRVSGKAPLSGVMNPQANIHQTVCYIEASQATQAIFYACIKLTRFLEEVWGFWAVEDIDFGLYSTKTITEDDNAIVLPEGYVFTGIRVMNDDNTWSDVELQENQRIWSLETEKDVIVQYKAEMG
jgi:hypothetical protein